MAANGQSGRFATILAGIAIALGGFGLYQIYEMHADLLVLANTVQAMQLQDETLSRHWKLHGWARDRITELRQVHGLDVASWPDLD